MPKNGITDLVTLNLSKMEKRFIVLPDSISLDEMMQVKGGITETTPNEEEEITIRCEPGPAISCNPGNAVGKRPGKQTP